jgi:hypothetical protein
MRLFSDVQIVAGFDPREASRRCVADEPEHAATSGIPKVV